MKHQRPPSTDKRLTVRISQDLWRRLHIEAEKQDVTATGLINRWLEERLSPTMEGSSPTTAAAEERALTDTARGETGETRPIWEEIAAIMSQVPEEELATLPTDLAEQHDHYLYGTPKRRGGGRSLWIPSTGLH
jgi:HicB family